ncbi:VOC family protein [Lacimicrobium alkaliphilum]|uniref:Glyoxalase n=1 Tax=Lacimicrobium alkaliphilum TaxID=1526571 RepID=A0A0U3AJX8_9ALTE|nr:VOC family protein [Lacimicrobium alkaliphilum]ALS98274.1 glyoxalase [Lacimicrobium alkaliphilum]
MIDIQATFPVMVAKNLDKLEHFYTGVFGFEAVFFDPDFYLHLVSPATGAQLGFLHANHQTQPAFLHPLMCTDGYVISFEVSDATKAYAEAKRLDLPVVMAMKDEEWGQRHFILEDPAGFKVDIVEHQQSPTN